MMNCLFERSGDRRHGKLRRMFVAKANGQEPQLTNREASGAPEMTSILVKSAGARLIDVIRVGNDLTGLGIVHPSLDPERNKGWRI